MILDPHRSSELFPGPDPLHLTITWLPTVPLQLQVAHRMVVRLTSRPLEIFAAVSKPKYSFLRPTWRSKHSPSDGRNQLLRAITNGWHSIVGGYIVLRQSSPTNSASHALLDVSHSQSLRLGKIHQTDSFPGPSADEKNWNDRGPTGRRSDCSPTNMSQPVVEISPSNVVKRVLMTRRGMAAEFIQSTSNDRIEYRFCSRRHLFVAFEQCVRRDGETFVAGSPRSTRRDLTGKLTFIPAGHEYHEWHDPRVPTSLMYFYFDPIELEAQSALKISCLSLSPRLFFEDSTLFDTVFKLKKLVESQIAENRLYFEALAIVLVHELVRLDQNAVNVEPQVRGGLAAWQQRVVTTYIDEHLTDRISLATLAQLVRLSPYHFCRAFKKSFGVPPHKYHTIRRIERAKILLEKRPLSVTDIGLALGFSDTSSFTAAFRKTTGLTPSDYHRSLS
jgi:AraC family transcriptional regulator